MEPDEPDHRGPCAWLSQSSETGRQATGVGSSLGFRRLIPPKAEVHPPSVWWLAKISCTFSFEVQPCIETEPCSSRLTDPRSHLDPHETLDCLVGGSYQKQEIVGEMGSSHILTRKEATSFVFSPPTEHHSKLNTDIRRQASVIGNEALGLSSSPLNIMQAVNSDLKITFGFL